MRTRIFAVRLAVKGYMTPEDIGVMMPLNVLRVTGLKIGHVYGYENTRGGSVGIVPPKTTPFDIQNRDAGPTIGGVSQHAELAYDPRIGWCYLCLNNKRNPIGNFHIGYVPPPQLKDGIWLYTMPDSPEWFELDVEVEPNSMITGQFFNEAAFSASAQGEGGTKYIVAIYFRCLVSDEVRPLEETLKLMAEHR